MKSLIILKGIAKTEKRRWVEKEGLQDFFIDIDCLRKLYSSPELITPFKGVLTKSFGDTVLSEFAKVLITRMSKGCLIVVDPENESLRMLENLAIIFGYTVFYVLQSVPHDFLQKPKKYLPPYYPLKRKEDLEKEVMGFLNLQLSDKICITRYSQVEEYWEAKCKMENYIRLGKESKPVLHVSDIHSNYSLYQKLPLKNNRYEFKVFYGDYIDGPEKGGSRKMIDEVLWGSHQRTIWLEGNHEIRLRKHLGIIMLNTGRGREIREILSALLPEDYLDTTANEFKDIDPILAKDYLLKMNEVLKLFAIIENSGFRYICTHSGLKYPEQISPKYIGNVIYGGRDINRHDRDFSIHTKKSIYWSIHAHCKYHGDWDVHKYPNVVNLDPQSNEEIIFAEQHTNNWNVCQIGK